MIYTKTGDKGSTSLVGGTRVEKFDIRVECYGTLDELNSFIGIIYDMANEQKDFIEKLDKSVIGELFRIINVIFNAEAIVACEKKDILDVLTKVNEDDISMLEKRIDSFSAQLPEFRSFILPCGDVLVSHIHAARTICRRAERLLCRLGAEQESVDQNVMKFINRLSDYFFMLSRAVLNAKGKEEILWKP